MEKQTIDAATPALSPALVGVNIAWLYALPDGRETCDALVLNEDNFAIKLVREALEGRAFSMPFAANWPASDLLNHFHFEAKNRERVFGQRTFGFGYPMLLADLKKDGSLPVAAPLFFWQLSTEPEAGRVDAWTISRGEKERLVPNFPLFQLLKNESEIDLTATVERLFSTQKITPSAVADLCEALKNGLGLQENGLPLSIGNCPTAENAPDLIERGTLWWAGILGNLPAISKAAKADASREIDIQYKGLEKGQHTFGMLAIDPTQRAAMMASRTYALSVVEGASGTGKTQTLANMIINALSNGKKCLVVSASANSLRRAQSFLLQGKFGDLSFILRDATTDLPVLLDILRASAENAKRDKIWDSEGWKIELTKTLRAQTKLDETFQALHTPIFEKMGWSEIVGRFLRANRTEGKELLLSQLHPADFEFSEKEYQSTQKAIIECQKLYEKAGTLKHPLSKLKREIFMDRPSEKGQDFARQWLDLMLDKSRDLHHRFLVKSNEYAESLTEHYESHFLELASVVARIREGVEDGVNRFGFDFEKPKSVTESLYGVFSEKYREMTAQKDRIAADYEALKKAHGSRKYFEFEFAPRFDSRDIKKTKDLAADFEASLRLWRKKTPGIVRQETSRVSSKTSLFDLDFRSQLEEIEYALDLFVEEFNQSEVFEDKIGHQTLTLPKRQEFLETVIEQLDSAHASLKDWPEFHVWQSFWLALEPSERKALAALIKIKPRNWSAAYESWFLHHLLQQEYTSNLTWDDATVQTYLKGRERLFDILPGQIGALWQSRKSKALRTLKNDRPEAYKNWFGKKNLETAGKLEAFFQENFEAMTETLPVILATPQVALDVVQAAEKAFDLVLIDEAHNISVQEGLEILKIGKTTVVFGDSKQDMTPLEQDDLLEFCKKEGAHHTFLEYQHQECPEEWARFNQIAFSTPFKRLPKGHSAFESTVVENVEGRFDEKTRTNEAEVRQIIAWLNDVKANASGIWPSIGIACATVEQRDLVASSLLKIRQRKASGWEKIYQMQINGLAVYQFGEMQGQHVDVLFLSLVHGAVDATGRLTDALHFWNSQLGLNQLHVALTRATSRLFLAHSIPSGAGAALAANAEMRGTTILSHLIEFAGFLQQNQPKKAEATLDSLRKRLRYKPDVAPPSVFLEEVEIALQPYFEPNRICRNAEVVGIGVPILVASKDEKVADDVLVIDGLVSRSGIPAFLFERKMVNFFTKNAVELVPTWSVNWWKNPRQEARRLAGSIIRREAAAGGES